MSGDHVSTLLLTAPPPHTVNAVEVLANQFECPKVFIDAELVSIV